MKRKELHADDMIDSRPGPCWHEGCKALVLWPQGQFEACRVRCSNGHEARAQRATNSTKQEDQ